MRDENSLAVSCLTLKPTTVKTKSVTSLNGCCPEKLNVTAVEMNPVKSHLLFP